MLKITPPSYNPYSTGPQFSKTQKTGITQPQVPSAEKGHEFSTSLWRYVESFDGRVGYRVETPEFDPRDPKRNGIFRLINALFNAPQDTVKKQLFAVKENGKPGWLVVVTGKGHRSLSVAFTKPGALAGVDIAILPGNMAMKLNPKFGIPKGQRLTKIDHQVTEHVVFELRRLMKSLLDGNGTFYPLFSPAELEGNLILPPDPTRRRKAQRVLKTARASLKTRSVQKP